MPDDAGFDFVFMDAAKGQYPAYLEQVMRFLVPGGILITDNVLQDGDIMSHGLRWKEETARSIAG